MRFGRFTRLHLTGSQTDVMSISEKVLKERLDGIHGAGLGQKIVADVEEYRLYLFH